MTAQEMWAQYTAQNGIDPATAYSAWHFCDNEADANELAELVFAGNKRATASCLWGYEYENESLPKEGNYNVILNWQGSAQGILKTSKIDIVPFGMVSDEFAAIEGEGDKSLDYWRKAHLPYFTRECEAMGKTFDDAMPVVCEQFSVVFSL